MRKLPDDAFEKITSILSPQATANNGPRVFGNSAPKKAATDQDKSASRMCNRGRSQFALKAASRSVVIRDTLIALDPQPHYIVSYESAAVATNFGLPSAETPEWKGDCIALAALSFERSSPTSPRHSDAAPDSQILEQHSRLRETNYR